MGNAATILAMKGSQVFTVEAQRSALHAVREMNRHHIGSLIVIDHQGRMQGIITERDVLQAMEREDCLTGLDVTDLMTRDMIVCRPDTPISDLRMIMMTRRVRHLPVIDANQLVGVISIGDVNAYLLAEEEVEIHWLHQYILGEPVETPVPRKQVVG